MSEKKLVEYDEIEYWNNRYARDETASFDWLCSWGWSKGMVEPHMNKSDRILVTGCGNANFSRDLWDDGYVKQVNIDYSEVCIEIMEKRNADAHMVWKVMDVRDMSEFPDASFDVVLDKSIIDTLACSTGSVENIDLMLKEVNRVLTPGGIYIATCYGEPDTRLHFIEGRAEDGLDWMVEVADVPQDPIHVNMLQGGSETDESPNYMYFCQKIPPGATSEEEDVIAMNFQSNMITSLQALSSMLDQTVENNVRIAKLAKERAEGEGLSKMTIKEAIKAGPPSTINN